MGNRDRSDVEALEVEAFHDDFDLVLWLEIVCRVVSFVEVAHHLSLPRRHSLEDVRLGTSRSRRAGSTSARSGG